MGKSHTKNRGNLSPHTTSSNNTVLHNNMTNSGKGLSLSSSFNNTILENTVINNEWFGFYIWGSDNNSIIGNTLANSTHTDLYFYRSSNNTIYHNRFIDDVLELHIFESTNDWNNYYPSGGNYWSDYEDRYPNAIEIDDSGIWDTPYVIDGNNVDNYPIIPEFPSLIILLLFMIATLLAALVCRRKKEACQT